MNQQMDQQTGGGLPALMPERTHAGVSGRGGFGRFWFAGGERTVAPIGLALAALVVGLVALSGWWSLHAMGREARAGEERELAALARVLASSSEALLEHRDMTAARRLVAEAARAHGLESCRIVLVGTDGAPKVLADADSSKITAHELVHGDGHAHAAAVAGAGGDGVETSDAEGLVRASAALVLGGQEAARVELARRTTTARLGSWDVQVGFAGIAAGGLVGLLVVYRQLRRRWRGLGAIREALVVEGAGEASVGELEVGEAFGPEARAWNGVVRERDSLRRRLALERAAEMLAAGSGVGGALAAACDAMWMGLIVLDEQARVVYSNGAAAAALKRSTNDLTGRGLGELVSDRELVEGAEALASGKSRKRVSVDIVQGDVERTVLRLTARAMRREEAGRAIVVVEDVTQQKVAEESRGAFVAQATHELRTPLTNIRLYVETLVEDDGQDAALRARCLNTVQSEVRRLERVVGDMLSTAEIEAGALRLHRAEVRLDQLFAELEADLRVGAEDKEIRLVFELPPKFGVIDADRDKLLLALHNVVGNAIKYTPAGGTVTVRVADEPGGLRVDVIDNGIGIKPEEHELVFERFYRAKDRRIANITGSGIGLALARQVIRMHAGEIGVASTPDKGSTFTITVPRTAEARPARAAA